MNLRELFATLTNDVVCRVALGRKYTGSTSGRGAGSGGESGRTFKELLVEFGELLGGFNIGTTFRC